MFEMWQDWVILFAVLGAAAYLVNRFIHWRHCRSACPNCKLREMMFEKDEKNTKSQSTD